MRENKHKIVWRAAHYATCWFMSGGFIAMFYFERGWHVMAFALLVVGLPGLLPAILLDRYYSRLFREGKSPSLLRSCGKGILCQIPATVVYLGFIAHMDCDGSLLSGMIFWFMLVMSPILNAAFGILLGVTTCPVFQMYLNVDESRKRRERFEQLRTNDGGGGGNNPLCDEEEGKCQSQQRRRKMKLVKVRCWKLPTGYDEDVFVTYPEDSNNGYDLVSCLECGQIYAVSRATEVYIGPPLKERLASLECIGCGKPLGVTAHSYPAKYVSKNGTIKTYQEPVEYPPFEDNVIIEFPSIYD